MAKPVKEIGKKITRGNAQKWVKKYKKEHPLDTNPTYGWLYGADILESLLAYDGADGIWFYKGIKKVTDEDGNEKDQECLVLYPADVNGNILDKSLNSLGAAATKTLGEDEPADEGQVCPPECPDN